MTYRVVVRGLPELRAALDDIQGKVDPELGRALTAAARPVKDDVRRRAGPFSARTESGVRIRRRGTMVRVEQGQAKTTGFHPTYGAFQQKHFFDPALVDHQEEVVRAASDAIDKLTRGV